MTEREAKRLQDAIADKYSRLKVDYRGMVGEDLALVVSGSNGTQALIRSVQDLARWFGPAKRPPAKPTGTAVKQRLLF